MTHQKDIAAAVRWAKKQIQHLVSISESTRNLSDHGAVMQNQSANEERRHLHNLIEATQQAQPDVITPKDISLYIERWRFDDDIDGAFGSYLMKLHPNGLRIVNDKQKRGDK